MMHPLLELLNAVPLAVLTLLVSFGFALGRVSWRGVSTGPAAGTLAVALLLGHLGVSLERLYGTSAPLLSVGQLGFALFIYSVGFEAGPRFFSIWLGSRAWRFVAVGTLVSVLAVAMSVICARTFGLDASVAAGVLSGALTSAPTYAAAAEVVDDGAALAVSFALTYPLGLVGLVLLVELLPRLARQPLSTGLASEDELAPRLRAPSGPEVTRSFVVEKPEATSASLAELALTRRTGTIISRVQRRQRQFVPDSETRLEMGDTLVVTGRVDELMAFAEAVGPEVHAPKLLSQPALTRSVRVSHRRVSGRSLVELDLVRRHHAVVTRIRRHDEFIEPAGDVALQLGDVVDLAGQTDDLRRAARELGHFEPPLDTTNIATYAGGITLGLLLGQLHLSLPGFDFRIGNAGGLLLVGLLLGRFRQVGGVSTHVPRPARQLVRDLGILLFVAETGLIAGSSLSGRVGAQLGATLVSGALVTLLPILGALALARWPFKLRPVDAWGSVCGGMTSSAALASIKRAADSSEPAISYAAAYAVASVLVTVAGPLLVRMLD